MAKEYNIWSDMFTDGVYYGRDSEEIQALLTENAKLREALERMVGACQRYLEEAQVSESDMYDLNYVSPLMQAKAALGG
jgi:hypothetical protein